MEQCKQFFKLGYFYVCAPEGIISPGLPVNCSLELAQDAFRFF